MSFIQLHVLRTLPFSNPNRDDAGRPKMGVLGGVERLRLSSQSIKRAIRESDAFFKAASGQDKCHRTRTVPRMVARAMLDAGISQEHIEIAINDIVGTLMSIKPRGTGRRGNQDIDTWLETVNSEELVFMSEAEISRLSSLCIKAAAENEPKPAKASKKKDGDAKGAVASTFGVNAKDIVATVFSDDILGVDIALFGRMLAKVNAIENNNVDGAVQVSHAMTTHRAVAEDDYFTAMDDLDANGAGLIQSQGFGSGTYYCYHCIDTATLVGNLGGDTEAAKKAIKGFIEGVITSIPGGKKTSFAHNTKPFYVRLETGSQVNRSLADAFSAPVAEGDFQAASIARIEQLLQRQERAYGPDFEQCATMNLLADNSQTLEDILALAFSAVE